MQAEADLILPVVGETRVEDEKKIEMETQQMGPADDEIEGGVRKASIEPRVMGADLREAITACTTEDDISDFSPAHPSKPHVRFSSSTKDVPALSKKLTRTKSRSSRSSSRSSSSSSSRSSRRRSSSDESPAEKRLRYAVEDGDAAKVEQCLKESGIDPNAELKREHATPLHLAAANGHHSVVELLLGLGVTVDAMDKHRVTPLHDACTRGNVQCVRLLLKALADPNHKDIDGCTAMHKAANYGLANCLLLLLEHGGNVNVTDNDGSTPLHRAACEMRHVAVELLIEHGASLTACDNFGQSVIHKAAIGGSTEIVELLHKKQISIDLEDKNGITPFLLCAAAGDEDTVLFLINCGANIFKKSRGLWTAVHFAANEGHVGMLNLLLLAGVPTAERDMYGRTPLHVAVEANSYACATFLLQMGENPLVDDNFGRSPLKSAKKDKRMWAHFEVVRKDKTKTHNVEQLLRKKYWHTMIIKFFSNMMFHTFSTLASFLPISYAQRTRPTTTVRGMEEGGGTSIDDLGDEWFIEEIFFKLLREELNDARTHRGDHLTARFSLLRIPQSITIYDLKTLLAQKYGLSPAKFRLCTISDLSPSNTTPTTTTTTSTDDGQGGDADEYDAEIRELRDSMVLWDCNTLLTTNTLYLDYIPLSSK